jgi:long-subunit fatty acid transport protein
VEWAFQSQNTKAPLKGKLGGSAAEVPNIFNWQNGVTWRTGLEYRLGQMPIIPVRVGYIYDTKVTNKAFPSAFGTPPAPTHTLTAGGGYVGDHWQANLAVTRRFGSTHINEADLGTGCAFCGFAGDYEITMTGLYVDASVDLDL